jgi:exoribonuclease-2
LKDLTSLKTYIIDSEDPHEVDDAISLEIQEGDIKNLWIHISNPCRLFLQDSNIDLDAKRRNSSLYLTDQYTAMLPLEILQEANLSQNKISKTISASIEFNEDGSINHYEIIEAIIKPKYQLTYEDANEILDLEPKEEFELVEIKNLLEKSIEYRKKQGAINFESPNSKLKLNKDEIIITKVEKTIAQIIIAEAMILMGYVTSLFLNKNNLAAAYRVQKVNCNPYEILNKYRDSEIKFILLKQYMGRSFITIKPNYKRAYYNLGGVLQHYTLEEKNKYINKFLLHLLNESKIVRPNAIAANVINALYLNTDLKDYLELVNNKLFLTNFDKIVDGLSNNLLLNQFMKVCPIPSYYIESNFKKIRKELLNQINSLNFNKLFTKFATTLSIQCFLNEYVYFVSEKDIIKIY